MELTIGAHNLTAGTSISMPIGAVTFTCDLDGNVSQKSYPRGVFDTLGQARWSGSVTNVVYNPTTGVMTLTTDIAHGLQNGNNVVIQ